MIQNWFLVSPQSHLGSKRMNFFSHGFFQRWYEVYVLISKQYKNFFVDYLECILVVIANCFCWA